MWRRKWYVCFNKRNSPSDWWLYSDFCVRSLNSQVESGYVAEADHKTMAKAIKDRVSLIRKKREQRQLVREEQAKRELEAEQQQQQQQQQETFKASHPQVC